MTSKTFPIKKGVACPLKWSWNTLRLSESSTACCHRVISPDPLTVENFQNFHNHPIWIEHRKLQLAGEFPGKLTKKGCQYCAHIEAQGGVSDRLYHMTQEGMTPPELATDPEALYVTPRVLEIFINNICNMSCIYCDESNSTKISDENRRYGYDVPGSSGRKIIPLVNKTDQIDELVDQFFLWLDKNYHHLEKLNVLGGEPFYQREFFRLIDFLAENQNKNLHFTVVSNLMVSKSILEGFVDKMQHLRDTDRIGRVRVTASIDCFGVEQEYVRYGLKLDQWMENFEYLCSHKWIDININNTITSLTIKTLPDLLTYINPLRQDRVIHHAFGLVDGRPHLHPRIFGPGFFNADFERILLQMVSYPHPDLVRFDYMKGLIKSINAGAVDPIEKQNLRCYLDEIDRRRNLDWKTVFPWLLEEFNRQESNV